MIDSVQMRKNSITLEPLRMTLACKWMVKNPTNLIIWRSICPFNIDPCLSIRLTNPSMSRSIGWLRPCLRTQSPSLSSATSLGYLRFYNAVRCYSTEHNTPAGPRIRMTSGEPAPQYAPEPYPRVTSNAGVIDYATLRDRYSQVKRNQTAKAEHIVRGKCLYC